MSLAYSPISTPSLSPTSSRSTSPSSPIERVKESLDIFERLLAQKAPSMSIRESFYAFVSDYNECRLDDDSIWNSANVKDKEEYRLREDLKFRRWMVTKLFRPEFLHQEEAAKEEEKDDEIDAFLQTFVRDAYFEELMARGWIDEEMEWDQNKYNQDEINQRECVDDSTIDYDYPDDDCDSVLSYSFIDDLLPLYCNVLWDQQNNVEPPTNVITSDGEYIPLCNNPYAFIDIFEPCPERDANKEAYYALLQLH
ncbi:4197_t:CDS:1 [Paraglomus brasilianum]|uniref:4197_t:CDS:1 n=1 Tax=Paraglomus brasilianum TaxID=144538 RepID=A0A9N9FQI6_9GLOM|nr:4197_t:CDS:1 [Paraglomus brasilianum]